MLPEMSEKDVNIERLAEKVLADNTLLSELLEGLRVKNETYRYNCSRVLTLISEQHGELLYPEWDYFVSLLSSDNTYHKLSAILIIANLVSVDTESRFEKILDTYYRLLDDRSMITAVYIARSSGKIVRAKPDLEPYITSRLLDIDKTHHESGRKELIKSGAIEALIEYYSLAEDRTKIIGFVKAQLESESPKTRRMAREFLKKL